MTKQILVGTITQSGSILKDAYTVFNAKGWKVVKHEKATATAGTAQVSTVDATSFNANTDTEVVVKVIDTTKTTYNNLGFTASGRTCAELVTNAAANKELSAFVTITQNANTITVTAVEKNKTFRIAAYIVRSGAEVALTVTYGTPAVFTVGQVADINTLIEECEATNGVTNKVLYKVVKPTYTVAASDLRILTLERVSDPQLIARVQRVDQKILIIADPGVEATVVKKIEDAFEFASYTYDNAASGTSDVTTTAAGLFTITHGLAWTPKHATAYIGDATDDGTYYIEYIHVNDTKLFGRVLARADDSVANAQVITINWSVRD